MRASRGPLPFLRLLAAAATVAAASDVAGAQLTISGDTLSAADSARLHDFAKRWSGSIALGVMQPLGEFADNVPGAVGVDAEAAFRVDRQGVLSLRALLNFTGYGHEVQRRMISNTIGARILVDVVTQNEILSVGVGPRLQVPRGPVRPYVAGSVGFANFTTSSHLRDENRTGDTQEAHFETRHLASTRFAWTGGAGILVPVRWARGTQMQVDLGATYHGGGEASYLRERDITDNPDGSISFSPRRTETRFLVYRLGVRIGI